MSEELKQAWKEVLFWAKRLSYYSADKHPEWREKYEAAKKRRRKKHYGMKLTNQPKRGAKPRQPWNFRTALMLQINQLYAAPDG